MHRVDSIGFSNQQYTLAVANNGNVFWAINYYKSGVIFGRVITVNFPGYGYTYLAVINRNGSLLKEYFADTVGGGNDNIIRIFNSNRLKDIVLLTNGKDESFKKWRDLPDSAKYLNESSTVIRLDSNGKLIRFNGLPASTDAVWLNHYYLNYALVTRQFCPTTSVLSINGANINNIGGNDYALWYVSTLKPQKAQIKHLLNWPISIGPNPTYGNVQIFGMKPNCLVEITLLNIYGDRVHSIVGYSNEVSNLELLSHSPGLYLVMIKYIETGVFNTYKLQVIK